MLPKTASLLALLLSASVCANPQNSEDDPELQSTASAIVGSYITSWSTYSRSPAQESFDSIASASAHQSRESEFFATLGPTYTTEPFLIFKPNVYFATPGMNEWLLPKASDGPNGETTTFEYAILTDGVKDGNPGLGFTELGMSVTIGPTTVKQSTFLDFTEDLDPTDTYVPKTVSGTYTLECSYTILPAISPLPPSVTPSALEHWPARTGVCTMDNEWASLIQPGSVTVQPGKYTFTMTDSMPDTRFQPESTVFGWPIMTVLGGQKALVMGGSAAPAATQAPSAAAAADMTARVNAVIVEVLVVVAAAVAM